MKPRKTKFLLLVGSLLSQEATSFTVSSHASLCPGASRSVCLLPLKSSVMDSAVDEVTGLEATATTEGEISLSSSNVTDITFEATLPTAAPTVLTRPDDWVSLWKRRLITHEDPLSIHKISSIVYSATGAGLLATAAIRYLMGPETFAEVPPSLALPLYAFSISNLIMCVASVRMSFLHRRFDLTARNAFLGTAVSSLFSGFYLLWTNPLGPEIFDNPLVTQACFAVFILLNVVFITDTCLKVPEVVEGRRDRKAEDYAGRFWVDTMGYVFPVAWGLPFVLVTGYVDAVLYDRTWFFEQCQYIDQMNGVPGMQANLSYLQILTSLAPSYGALFVTLRDKKLITKQQELVGITAFSTATLVWTIFATSGFFAYFTWPSSA